MKKFLLVFLIFILTVQLLGPSFVYAFEPAVYNDPDSGDIAGDYRLQISTVSDFASIFWDSGKTALSASTTQGSSTPEISYSGTSTLAVEATYYWRIKLWDAADDEGPWTNGRDYFFTAGHRVQDISYTYDPVGNITQIDDNSYTDARKLATFAYDDLYRLTSASSTTDTSIELYHETYAYDSIGNITNKSDVGNYLYQETDYANPHAATSVNGQTYTYDNNGNLTSDGNLTLVWDYRNRLASASSTTDFLTYAYDHNNQRTEITNGSSTTVYPNKLYNTDGTTETKHIFDHEGTVIATAETAASSTQVYYNHPDHLTGSNVVSNEEGALEQTLDYFPFGGIRVNDRNSVFDEQRKFTGQEYDADTNLHYYIQRYYAQDIGRFTSQDRVFLNLGIDQRTQKVLGNPQALNAYSYTINNPLRYVDEEGEIFEDVPFIAMDIRDISAGLLVGTYGLVSGNQEYRQKGLDFAEASTKNLGVDIGSAFIPGFSAGALRFVGKNMNLLPSIVHAPKGIKFGQGDIGQNFRDIKEVPDYLRGRPIADVAADLKSGKLSPDQLPINYVVRNGENVALDNRSLTTLQLAGKEPTILNNRTGQQFFEKQLDDHLGGGNPSDTIRIRGVE